MIENPKTAILLAADKIQHLKPITDFIPKPLIRIAGRSILKRALDRLTEAGVEKVIVVTNEESQKIDQRLSKYEHDLEIIIKLEEEPENSLQSAKLALDDIDEEFVWVINTDILWLYSKESSLNRLCRIYNSQKMDAALLMYESAEAWGNVRYGDYFMAADGRLEQLPERQVSPWVYTGIQILPTQILKNAPTDKNYDMHQLWDELLDKERLYGVLHDGEWFHFDNVDSLELAKDYMSTHYAYTPRRF
ncbi:MAG: sugar phosphate nucleotidyltransferase [Alphaproteobacteria bacterium]